MATIEELMKKKADLLAQGEKAKSGTGDLYYGQEGGTGGKQYDYLTELLKGNIDSGNTLTPGVRQFSQGQINNAYNTGQEKISENFAGKGTFGSGVHANAAVNLEGGRANAIGQNELGLEEMNQNLIQQQIARLLQINDSQAGRSLGVYGLQENARQFGESLSAQKDAQPSDFMQLLGSILGGGAQVASSYFLGNN